jgi:hypothetical protein
LCLCLCERERERETEGGIVSQQHPESRTPPPSPQGLRPIAQPDVLSLV